ncbi:hypothetical protein [Hydrogenimonas sp. SS33]|uniref:hypothetical protein n=1 Tax=Hydrogenimonas leucolamina TaxID=2954236 RepID=UPI00336BF8CA
MKRFVFFENPFDFAPLFGGHVSETFHEIFFGDEFQIGYGVVLVDDLFIIEEGEQQGNIFVALRNIFHLHGTYFFAVLYCGFESFHNFIACGDFDIFFHEKSTIVSVPIRNKSQSAFFVDHHGGDKRRVFGVVPVDDKNKKRMVRIAVDIPFTVPCIGLERSCVLNGGVKFLPRFSIG